MSRVFISEGTGAGIYVFRRSLPCARPPSRRRLDRECEIFLPRQYGRTDQHRPGQEHSSATRSEPSLERCSSASAGLSTWLVADESNDLFGEPMGLGEQSGKDRASPETHSECETDRRGRIRSHQGTGSCDLSGWHKNGGESMTTNVQRISDAEYAAALAAGRIEAETEIRAQAVR